CGGVVDKGRAFANAVEGAVLAKRDLAQVVVVADAAHDEVLTGGGGPRGGCALAAELLDPLLGLGGGAVIDRDLVATFVLEVPGYRIAHHAKPEKRHLRHDLLPIPDCCCSIDQSGRSSVNWGWLTNVVPVLLCAGKRNRQGHTMALSKDQVVAALAK